MFCPNCGKEVGNATKFCPACGTPLGRSHVGKPRGGRRRVIIVIVAACVVIIGCAVGVFQYNREKNSIWVPTSMQIEIDGQEEAAYADYNSAQFLAGAGLYNYYPRADLAFSMNEMLEGGYPAVKINLNIDDTGKVISAEGSKDGTAVDFEPVQDDYGNTVGLRNMSTGGEEIIRRVSYDADMLPTIIERGLRGDGREYEEYDVVTEGDTFLFNSYRYAEGGVALERLNSDSRLQAKNGILTGMLDSEGRVTPFDITYDNDGRVVEVKTDDEDFRGARFAYDDNGNVSCITMNHGDSFYYKTVSISFKYQKIYNPTPLVRMLGGTLVL